MMTRERKKERKKENIKQTNHHLNHFYTYLYNTKQRYIFIHIYYTMPSSAYVTSVDIESGLSTGDTLLTTATIGGAVVAGAAVGIGKVAPKSIKNKIKRQKSYLKKQS